MGPHFIYSYILQRASALVASGKELPNCQCRKLWIQSCGGNISLEKEMGTLPQSPGKSHRQKSLVGYSPWGRKKWGMTWWQNNSNNFPKEPIIMPWPMHGVKMMVTIYLQLRLSLYYWQSKFFLQSMYRNHLFLESKSQVFKSGKYLAIIFSVWFFSDAYKDIWNHLLILFSVSFYSPCPWISSCFSISFSVVLW